MDSPDGYELGYGSVDDDAHTPVLVSTMEETAGWPSTKRIRAWEREHLALTHGERLLDVGCGRGEAALTLAEDVGRTGSIVGVDSSITMLQVARRLHRSTECSAGFVLGDARRLGLPDHSFDVVRSERTLQWLPGPDEIVRELVRVLRPNGRMSLIDTDWSTLHLDVGDPEITRMVGEAFRVERDRPSNVGRQLARLARSAGRDVVAETTETQRWSEWDPDASPAPGGLFSMASLARDLVERDHLADDDAPGFVETIHEAARRGRFRMSLTMHAVVAR